jgi:hypothetical protein
MLVLLPMLIGYFNDCAHALSLNIATQTKNMGRPSTVAFRKVVPSKKKEFVNLKDLHVSFKAYFESVEFSSSISTTYYLLLY